MLNIFNRIRKIKLSLLVITLLALATIFAGAAHADKITTSLDKFQEGLGDDKGINKQTFDFQSTAGIFSSTYTILTGCKSPSCPTSLRAGAIDYVNVAIADIYSAPPASGVYYFADVGRN